MNFQVNKAACKLMADRLSLLAVVMFAPLSVMYILGDLSGNIALIGFAMYASLTTAALWLQANTEVD